MHERLSIKYTSPPAYTISLHLYSLSRKDTERKLSVNVGREGKNNTAESAELKHEHTEMIPQEVSDNEFEWGCWTGQEESSWETTEVHPAASVSLTTVMAGKQLNSAHVWEHVLKHRGLHPLTWTYSEACSHERSYTLVHLGKHFYIILKQLLWLGIIRDRQKLISSLFILNTQEQMKTIK